MLADNHLSSRDIVMDYSILRGITQYRIGRRKLALGETERRGKSSNSSISNPSSYEYFAQSEQEGQLEIKEDRGTPEWTTTRSIIVRSPSRLEQCRYHVLSAVNTETLTTRSPGLPAYYVSVTLEEPQVSIEWSDCDQSIENGRSKSE